MRELANGGCGRRVLGFSNLWIIAAAWGVCLLGAVAPARAIILYDNLANNAFIEIPVTTDDWVAQQFLTDVSDHTLVSVTLVLGRGAGTNAPLVQIYSDGPGSENPGNLLTTLTGPSEISGSPTNIAFTASGFALSKNTIYWVVLKAASYSGSDQLGWYYTDNNSGTGNGFSTKNAQFLGGAWSGYPDQPFLMRIETTVIDIVPASGPFAGGNSVLVTNAAPAIGNGSDITNIVLGGVGTTNIIYQGSNWVRFVAPSVGSAGLKNIMIQSGSVGDTTLTNGYTVNPRGVLSSVAPSSGPVTGGYPVVLSGTNLCNGSDITSVTLCNSNVASIVSQSPTQIVVTAGAGAAGAGDVRVFSTSYGETVNSNAFTYQAPTMVILDAFYMRKGSGGVSVCWQTASESDALGFDVYREEAGAWVKVNSVMIPATGWPAGGIGAGYCVVDPGASVDGSYIYKLVEYETTGGINEYGPFQRSVGTPRVSSIMATPAGVVVQWPSRELEVYDVLKAADPRGAYVPAASGLPATPPVNAWTDQTGAAGAAYYRIQVR